MLTGITNSASWRCWPTHVSYLGHVRTRDARLVAVADMRPFESVADFLPPRFLSNTRQTRQAGGLVAP
jgi:hypothetical protein